MTIKILRLGHRLGRDDRISTHCGLVARALGVDSIIYSGDKDGKMVESVNDVTKRFGGPFKASYESKWKDVIRNYKKKKYSIVHLTVYGLPIQKQIGKIRKHKNILLIVGSEKVPWEAYEYADYNISVSSQPHSEIASLAVFLHDYFKGKELEKKFRKASIRIEPQIKGKKIIEKVSKNLKSPDLVEK